MPFIKQLAGTFFALRIYDRIDHIYLSVSHFQFQRIFFGRSLSIDHSLSSIVSVALRIDSVHPCFKMAWHWPLSLLFENSFDSQIRSILDRKSHENYILLKRNRFKIFFMLIEATIVITECNEKKKIELIWS